MDDDRIREFETSLWTGDAEQYRRLIDDSCVMVLPAEPYIFSASAAIAAVSETPRWDSVDLADLQIARPQEGVIAIAYHATARRGEERYSAHCTSVLRRCEHEVWRVIQHQQTPPITSQG
ncbi:DUF4440 domain-containing protein [Sphingomonas japonica]|uniref:DUF4440 domain-containing protein n=1 Tax=Sphingomonas japonica TaxID=511662 RepID=A0ABX0U1R3_9SPHN|nr:DUF4440 domain-containing protein [Sphingomonas japonica]NIJ24511.1 hypothetical protein [Sphingomonas japonica]